MMQTHCVDARDQVTKETINSLAYFSIRQSYVLKLVR